MARNDGLKLRNSPAVSVIRQATQYYSITTLHKDLAVLQTLCCVNGDSELRDTIQLSTNELRREGQAGVTSGGARSRDVISYLWRDRLRNKPQAELVIEDTEQNQETRDHEAIRQQPVSQQLRRRREASMPRSGNEWTVSYELTLRQLNDVENSEITDVDTVLNEARETLQTSGVSEVPPMQTLEELSEGELLVRDLHAANASLDNLQHFQAVNRVERTPMEGTEPDLSSVGLVLRPIGLTGALRLNDRNRLSSLQQSVVENWISPLSDDIPDIILTVRTQRALRMAIEVTLASLVIRPEDIPHDELPQSENHDSPFNLALRPFGVPPSSPATPSVYFDASSQLQSSVSPTPSRSTTPSTITSSGRASAVAAPEIARLSRYTTFSKPAPPSLPRALRRVMSHWIPGTDPVGYDWQATSHHFARQDEEEEGEELTEKEQRRRQRRLERHARRRQRHEEESQRIQIRSSQAPEIMTESQPTQTGESYGVNVGTGYSQAAASQILPGRHGGRQPPRKKRKSGF